MNLMIRPKCLASVAFLFVSLSTAWAEEYAILKSGLRMSAQTIEKQDGSYFLKKYGGVIVLSESEVVRIEKDDYIAPPEAAKAAVSVPTSAASTAGKPVDQMLDEAASRNGLPAGFVKSVARVESGMRTDLVSKSGAIGVMQLMPATAAALKADPNNPEQNIEAGTRYLRDLLLRYDGDAAKALAAYNAGPAAVDRFNGVPPYVETVTYVDRVLRDYNKKSPMR